MKKKILLLVSLLISCAYAAEYPLNLRKSVNMGLSDPIANDRKGGWTDQGPENDMSVLKPGTLHVSGVPFEIIDENGNNGKAAIVLRGSNRLTFLPREAEIAIPGNRKVYKNLYLLNAVAWGWDKALVGKAVLYYSDGSTGEQTLWCGAHTNDFWGQARLKRTLLAWTGKNRSAAIGLYATEIPLRDRPLERVVVRSEGSLVWMIAAATLTDRSLRPVKSETVKITEGPEWRKLPAFRLRDRIRKDSILDFSDAQETPAGKHGRLIVRGNRFYFENRPEKPVRFAGTNLTAHTTDPLKEDAPAVADDLARLGCNAVRIHGHDGYFAKSNSPELDPSAIDRFDFLIAELKKRGIYYTTDLYVHRIAPAGKFKKLPPSMPLTMLTYKLACFINTDVRNDLKQFIKNLLTHVNPYTGIAYKDDPQLLTLSVVNENPIHSDYLLGALERRPEFKKVFLAEFQEYCRKKGIPADEKKYWFGFLDDLYRDYYRDMAAFLRSLGVRAPLTEQNMTPGFSTLALRDEYDFADNHHYAGHPNRFTLPAATRAKTHIREPFPGIGGSRLLHKPFTVTEWCWSEPSAYASEGAAYFPAIASLQGWDMLFSFEYGRGCAFLNGKYVRTLKFAENTMTWFNIGENPMRRLAEILASALFLRGEVRESDVVFPLLIDRRRNFENRREPDRKVAEAYYNLGKYGKIGAVIAHPGREPEFPEGTRAVISDSGRKIAGFPVVPLNGTLHSELARKKLLPVQGNLFRSSTGQLLWNRGSGAFSVTTPGIEALVLPEGAGIKGNLFSGVSRKTFATVAAIAKDGRPLNESDHILILHLSDVKNNNIVFTDKSFQSLENWGDREMIAKHAVADVRFGRSLAGFRLYACGFNGERGEELPLNGNTIHLDNFRGKNVTCVYELIKK